MTSPKLVFIIPYRNREEQLFFFRRQIKYILEDYTEDEYKIFYIHQNDKRPFNRGALKNIGFLITKQKYPNDYQNITFIFNDVDTIANRKNLLSFETTRGVIKHFYGFRFALGGIVSITGYDFEFLNGFPNFWAWGYEDNLLQKRAEQRQISIDRSQFFNIMDPHIIHLNESVQRVVNRQEYNRFVYNSTEGIDRIQNLIFEIDETDSEMIRIQTFSTGIEANKTDYSIHDISKSNKPFENRRMPMII